MLEGSEIRALVVGGGRVAARKVQALLDAGATVRVLAPRVEIDLVERATQEGRLTIRADAYSAEALGNATLVIAATSNPAVNAEVARDARSRGCLVNVVDAPGAGTFTTPAVHRAGEVTIAVSAGGVPGAAVRIRDLVADAVDARFGEAIDDLSALRRRFLDEGRADRWKEASSDLLDEDFVTHVRAGSFAERMALWR